MRVAIDEARAGEAEGEVPVGAVVVRGDAVLARSGNRVVRDSDGTAHAELLAIRAAMRAPERGAGSPGEARLTDCTLYITLEPCAMCAGAIVLARVGRVVFGAWDDKAGMAGSVGDLLRHPRLNHRPQVLGGACGEECGALLSGFFRARRESAQGRGASARLPDE
jgi:tRNA(adenine34) deaminase